MYGAPSQWMLFCTHNPLLRRITVTTDNNIGITFNSGLIQTLVHVGLHPIIRVYKADKDARRIFYACISCSTESTV